jgi:hypothetical protein
MVPVDNENWSLPAHQRSVCWVRTSGGATGIFAKRATERTRRHDRQRHRYFPTTHCQLTANKTGIFGVFWGRMRRMKNHPEMHILCIHADFREIPTGSANGN